MTRQLTLGFITVLIVFTGCLPSQRSKSSLCILSFRVIDADSGQPIIPYECVNPTSSFAPDSNPSALPKNMKLFINNNEGVFACVSDGPVEIILKANGYTEKRIVIQPANYLTSVSSKEFQEVKLSKVNAR